MYAAKNTKVLRYGKIPANGEEPSYGISFSTYPTLPIGTSTTAFNFSNTYNNQNGTERIIVYLVTNGCQSYPVDSGN